MGFNQQALITEKGFRRVLSSLRAGINNGYE
jgi:hypothetical protein